MAEREALQGGGCHRSAYAMGSLGLVLATMTSLWLGGCQRESEAAPPEVRPVRTLTVAKRDVGETVTYTGRIEAEVETRLSFRISGRMIERPVNASDRVEPGQVVARLEPVSYTHLTLPTN